MRLNQFYIVAPTTVLLAISPPFRFSFPVTASVSPAVAQVSEDRKSEADRLLQQGNEKLNANQAQAALPILQQALTIYQDIQDREGEGQALKSLGNAHYSLQEYREAIAYQQQALEIAQDLNNRDLESRALNNLGLVYKELGDSDKAIEYYQQSLAISEPTQNQEIQLITFYNLGEIYSSIEDYSQAIDYYHQALSITQERQDKSSQMQILGNLGFAYSSLGNTTKAIEAHEQSLAIAQELGNQGFQVTTLISLGSIYNGLGDSQKAIEYGKQSLAIAHQINNQLLEAQALELLGSAYTALGESEQGIAYLQQSLRLARELQTTEFHDLALGLEELTLDTLIRIYQMLEEHSHAIEYSEQKLNLALETGDREREGDALKDIGVIYIERTDYIKAIEYLEQSLTVAREIKAPVLEVQALDYLGSTYWFLGNFERTYYYFKQILQAIRDFNRHSSLNPENLVYARTVNQYFKEKEVLVLSSLGEITYIGGFGNTRQAIDYFQESLALARTLNFVEGESQALSSLGGVYLILGDYRKAIDYYQQALEQLRQDQDSLSALNYRRQEGNLLGTISRAYGLLGEHERAIEYAQQGLAIASELETTEESLDRTLALDNLGFALFLAGRFSEAEPILRDAIRGYESVREGLGERDEFKVSIFEIQNQPYKLLEQTLVARNRPNEALEIAEQGRARTFVELLGKKLAVNREEQFTNTHPTIEQIQRIAREQNATLVQYSIIYDPALSLFPGQLLAPKQVPESELFIWVIKPTGEIDFRRFDLKSWLEQQDTSLKDFIIDTRESIGVRGGTSLDVVFEPGLEQRDRLKQLHQLLVEPIADLLPTEPSDAFGGSRSDHRVIFIPQGELFLVPFPALQDQQGDYLIEKHTILTAPAIQVLELTRQQRERIARERKNGEAGQENILVVGNPTMPSVPPQIGDEPQPLANLPGAKQEAEAIASLFNTQPLTGNAATETAIKAKLSQARIIHLATHGLLNDFQALQSAIALAPDSPSSLAQRRQVGNDGLLTAEEILDLNLNAELVVLSACNTGRGRITGDGVIGLSRSLFLAGTPSVIVSLWSVPDDPTQELMTEFYHQLQLTTDKAQALRQAMLEMKEKYPNTPRMWAAFTLIGEADSTRSTP